MKNNEEGTDSRGYSGTNTTNDYFQRKLGIGYCGSFNAQLRCVILAVSSLFNIWSPRGCCQRGLTGLYRNKLSCGHMFRLQARPLPPLPSANCLSFSVSLCVAGPDHWRETGGGRGAELADCKKVRVSINRSILSGCCEAWSGQVAFGQSQDQIPTHRPLDTLL